MSDLHKIGPVLSAETKSDGEVAFQTITRLDYAELLVLRYGQWREKPEEVERPSLWAGEVVEEIFRLAKEEYDEEARRQRARVEPNKD